MKAKIYSNFVKANENIFNGDLVKIVNEGNYSTIKTKEGNKKEVMKFDLELANGEVKEYTMNNMTTKNMVKAFSDETKNWIGKPLRAWIIQQLAFGEMIDVLILTPKSWKKATEGTTEEIPTIEDGEDLPDVVDNDDIPF